MKNNNLTSDTPIKILLNDALKYAKVGVREIDLSKNTLTWSDVYQIHEGNKSFKPKIDKVIAPNILS